jgi:hypothetical protein
VSHSEMDARFLKLVHAIMLLIVAHKLLYHHAKLFPCFFAAPICTRWVLQYIWAGFESKMHRSRNLSSACKYVCSLIWYVDKH